MLRRCPPPGTDKFKETMAGELLGVEVSWSLVSRLPKSLVSRHLQFGYAYTCGMQSLSDPIPELWCSALSTDLTVAPLGFIRETLNLIAVGVVGGWVNPGDTFFQIADPMIGLDPFVEVSFKLADHTVTTFEVPNLGVTQLNPGDSLLLVEWTADAAAG